MLTTHVDTGFPAVPPELKSGATPVDIASPSPLEGLRAVQKHAPLLVRAALTAWDEYHRSNVDLAYQVVGAVLETGVVYCGTSTAVPCMCECWRRRVRLLPEW